MEICYGYLFKTRNIKYQNINHTVFEFLDVVVGMGFYNSKQGERYQILTGNYADIYANDSKNNNIVDYMFFKVDLENRYHN